MAGAKEGKTPRRVPSIIPVMQAAGVAKLLTARYISMLSYFVPVGSNFLRI